MSQPTRPSYFDLLKSTSLTWGSPKSAAFLAKATTCTSASMVEYRNLEVVTHMLLWCVFVYLKRRAFTLLAGNSCCSYFILIMKNMILLGKKPFVIHNIFNYENLNEHTYDLWIHISTYIYVVYSYMYIYIHTYVYIYIYFKFDYEYTVHIYILTV